MTSDPMEAHNPKTPLPLVKIEENSQTARQVPLVFDKNHTKDL